ncbi:matrixin family metalloprotease [Hymenobacter humi]|uniref:Matrixin family metalloprotease n=1 Tax=Hymenobacter humi TaxID=1411620 RepID=A0ABW2U2W6_9BACT
MVFYVKEVDMQYDDAAIFQFGPANAVGSRNEIDFETVVVHELGHAHQLGHLILPGAVMHYAIGRGQNTRSLNPASDIIGGRQVLRVRSFKKLACGPAPMLPAPLTSFSAQFTNGLGVTVSWATKEECFLNNFIIERSTSSDTTTWTRVGTVAPKPPGSTYDFSTRRFPAACSTTACACRGPMAPSTAWPPCSSPLRKPAPASLFSPIRQLVLTWACCIRPQWKGPSCSAF